MRSVYLKGRLASPPIHSLYREILQHPPEGFQYITHASSRKKPILHSVDQRILSARLVKDLWYELRGLLYTSLERLTKISEPSELVFASQQLLFSSQPWVADFEFANALVGYGDIRPCERILRRAVSSVYCKKLMPWSDWAKKTMYASLDCTSFENKMETVRLAVPSKSFTKTRSERLRLLFVGSTNPFNVQNFELKGGPEVLEASNELCEKYEHVELFVRSWVPSHLKERYARNKRIVILDKPLSESALSQLYASSDLFVFPSHANLGMAILEAMSYQLPVVALRIYDVPEAVEDMKTGLLLEPSDNVPYYMWNGAPNHYSHAFIDAVRRSRRLLVNQMVEKLSMLIEGSPLRRQMGIAAKNKIDAGEFSITARNTKLKRIFEEASSR